MRWNILLYNKVKNFSKLLFPQHFVQRSYYPAPFINLYEKATGEPASEYFVEKLKKKHPALLKLTDTHLQYILQILSKFEISTLEACLDPHVFCMNQCSLDNYGEILKECKFVKIVPKHIIRYHTIVNKRMIAKLKEDGLIRADLILEDVLYKYFDEMPDSQKNKKNFKDSQTPILTVRMSVLQNFLSWKLKVSEDEFQKYMRNYLPMKHRPMNDINEALALAQYEIGFDLDTIRKNGFVISADPTNTKLIIENVETIMGLDIREVLRLQPGILKNNYKSILQIRSLLEEYRISHEAQRKCLRIYCMNPETVSQRLNELKDMKEYQILSSNPRVLFMIVHKKKMLNRLDKIQKVQKQCYSLNHLVASNNIFDQYINGFGDKANSRDLAILVCTSLNMLKEKEISKSKTIKATLKELKKQKYYLHAALNVIDENIQYLKTRTDDTVIYENCQLLLYPLSNIKQYSEILFNLRDGVYDSAPLDASYNMLDYSKLTDTQILSLVLYEIEKRHHFSGDGIWATQDGHESVKVEQAQIIV